MKRFRFRLQAALDHRQRNEDRLRGEVARIRMRLSAETARLADLGQVRERAARAAARERLGRSTAETHRETERYIEALDANVQSQRNLIDVVERELQVRVAETVAAMRDTRSLENLRGRQSEEHLRAALREEQRDLDELAGIRAARAG